VNVNCGTKHKNMRNRNCRKVVGDPLGVGALSDLCDINAYTVGALFLIIVGFIGHIILNKKYIG